MAVRPLLTFAALALLLGAPACTTAKGRAIDTPELVAPDTIADLDDYASARNAYALMPVDDPGRGQARQKLRTYLLSYLDRALDTAQPDAAIEALEQLAGLWLASELPKLEPDPELAAAAERVYTVSGAAGDERPALLGLAFMQAFGTPEIRGRAEKEYAQLADWLERTAQFGGDPRLGSQLDSQLDRLLEDVSSHLPSPFIVDHLATLYLERYRDAQRSVGLSDISDPRIPFTGYLLARLYLRADDLPAAIDALERVKSDEPTDELRKLMIDAEEASRTGRSPLRLDELIWNFIPDPENRLPDEIVHQSWGIVDNLARRSLARFPDHPPAHLARGRYLRSRNYFEAAIVHYERAFAGKSRATNTADLREAWSELAQLYQFALEARAESGSAQLAEMLERVEAFHARAAATWPQRPIEPGVALAWMTVGLAEFNAGNIDHAESLMRQAAALEPHPAALALLGTIAMRRGEFVEAREQLARLDNISERFPDQLERYDWQITAHLDRAELEALAGEREASVEQLRVALRELNTLLSYPGLPNSVRAEFTLRRARVFFFLDEIGLAMEDARAAQSLAPERDDAHTVPLLFTVVHGHLDEARELLDSALARDEADELGVYYSLWLLDLAERLGEPAPDGARAYLEGYAADASSDAWQRKLALYGLGKLDYEVLAGAADDSRQRSEAYFYEGLRRWRSGSHEASLKLMRKVLEQQMMGDFEYEMAQSYLSWNELPKTARAAL